MNLDLINEVRTNADERIAKYKNLMARQHDAMVKPSDSTLETSF